MYTENEKKIIIDLIERWLQIQENIYQLILGLKYQFDEFRKKTEEMLNELQQELQQKEVKK
jgi:RNase H-fold protein (predicted Holliday junction resolvase)